MRVALHLGCLALLTAAACAPEPYQSSPTRPYVSPNYVYRVLPGASTVVQPGVVAGYGITANVGYSYRLIWTGNALVTGTWNEFFGTVWTPPNGNILSVNTGCGGYCPFESGDWISNVKFDTDGGQRVDFDSFAATEMDGFDFVVDSEPVYFDLMIDGVRFNGSIYFPATDTNPPGQIASVASIPFGLTIQ